VKIQHRIRSFLSYTTFGYTSKDCVGGLKDRSRCPHVSQGKTSFYKFNVVTADTLREAQAHPEQHRDLIVRVAGYSDYFLDCSVNLQNEIIRRTEHLGF